MKSLKGKVFWLLIALSGVISLQGMFPSRLNRLNLNKIRLQNVKSRSQSSGGVEVTKSSWLQTIQSKMQSLWQEPKKSLVPVFLAPKVITPEEINTFLEPTKIAAFNHSTKKHIMLFSDDNLDMAKIQLGNIINGNPKAKSYIIETIRDENGKVLRSFTILDKILLHLSEIAQGKMTVESTNMLNYVKLIEFLVGLGAKINLKNSDLDKKLFKTLMLRHRKLVATAGEDLNVVDLGAVRWKITLLEEVLTKLGPVLDALIPEFEDERKKAKAQHGQYQKKVRQKELKREQQRIIKRELERIERERQEEEWGKQRLYE